MLLKSHNKIITIEVKSAANIEVIMRYLMLFFIPEIEL